MIDAEIYGITPSEKIENLARAPPEMASYNSHKSKSETAPWVPGTGIVLPIINTNKHANVNNTLLRISLFFELNNNLSVLNILNHLDSSTNIFNFLLCSFWKLVSFNS